MNTLTQKQRVIVPFEQTEKRREEKVSEKEAVKKQKDIERKELKYFLCKKHHQEKRDIIKKKKFMRVIVSKTELKKRRLAKENEITARELEEKEFEKKKYELEQIHQIHLWKKEFFGKKVVPIKAYTIFPLFCYLKKISKKSG